VTQAQEPRFTALRARLRKRAPVTTITSPPLPAPLPESDYRRAERLVGPAPHHPWASTAQNPWAQAQAPDEAAAAEPGSTTSPAVHGTLAASRRTAVAGRVDVLHLRPGSVATRRPAAQDLVVIDRAALFEGVWAGTETARGTALLHELMARIEDARARGATAVLIESPHAPNVGTNLVRDAVDHIVSPDAPVAGPGASQLSPSHRSIVEAILDPAHSETTKDAGEPG
jgi:hypothetical protein